MANQKNLIIKNTKTLKSFAGGEAKPGRMAFTGGGGGGKPKAVHQPSLDALVIAIEEMENIKKDSDDVKAMLKRMYGKGDEDESDY